MNKIKAKALFKTGYLHNWDNGILRLFEIINKKDCDLGTAIMLFWMGSPDYYYNSYEIPSNGEPDENYRLLKTIEQKVTNGDYKTLISYNPSKEHPIKKQGKIPEIMCLEVKADIDFRDIVYPKKSPSEDFLFEAITKCKSKDDLIALEKNGIDFSKKIDKSYPIRLAISFENFAAMEYFIDKGFNMNQKIRKNPLIFTAISTQNIKILKLLVKHGAKIKMKGVGGSNALHYVASRFDEGQFNKKIEEIVLYLIEQGISPTKKIEGKYSPLELATLWDKKSYVKLLKSVI